MPPYIAGRPDRIREASPLLLAKSVGATARTGFSYAVGAPSTGAVRR